MVGGDWMVYNDIERKYWMNLKDKILELRDVVLLLRMIFENEEGEDLN